MNLPFKTAETIGARRSLTDSIVIETGEMVLAMATFRHCYREYRRKRETLEILLSRLRVGQVEDTSIERKEIIATVL